MSLYSLLAGGIRAEDGLSLTSERGWDSLVSSCSYGPTTSGVTVTPQIATALSAYYACITVISQDLILAPLKVFKERADGGRDLITDHPVAELLGTKPNDDETAIAFREDWVAMALGWAHGYVRIDRNTMGEPAALVRLNSERVKHMRDDNGPFYIHYLPDGTPEIIRAENMLDLYGVLGWSTACQGKEVLGIALAEQAYASTFLGQASAPNGIITTDGKMSDQAKEKLQESWQKMHGGVKGTGKVAIFSGDMKYETVSIDPATAQLLESRKYSVEEICRYFNVHPSKVQDRTRAQGWSTNEQAGIDHVRYTLLPWAIRVEAMLDLRLFTEEERREGYYTRHLFQGLQRGDMKARTAYYRLMHMMGAMTANEMRNLEEMNPIEGEAANSTFLSLSIAKADDVASGEARDKSPSGGGDRGSDGGEANTSGREDAGAEDGAQAMAAGAMTPAFEDVFGRMLQREYKAVTRLAGKHEDPAARAAAVEKFIDGEHDRLASALLPSLLCIGYAGGVCDAVAAKVTADFYEAAMDAYRGSGDVATVADARRRDEPELWAARLVATLTGKDIDDVS